MFETIAQGIEVYKKEVLELRRFVKKLDEKYGPKVADEIMFQHSGYFEHQEFVDRSKKIVVMEQALGMTNEEANAIFEEAKRTVDAETPMNAPT